MSVALERDLYEQFEPREDSLYFKIGEGGVICFHGCNCHIRKRMSSEQIASLFNDSAFVQISSDCYVNVKRITEIEEDCLYFSEKLHGDKRIPITKRVREQILQRLNELPAI